jgi:hypothetical protein
MRPEDWGQIAAEAERISTNGQLHLDQRGSARQLDQHMAVEPASGKKRARILLKRRSPFSQVWKKGPARYRSRRKPRFANPAA